MIQPIDVCVFTLVAALVWAVTLASKRFSVAQSPTMSEPVLRMRRDVLLNRDTDPRAFLAKFDHWFERVLIRSGIDLDRMTCMILITCLAIVAGAIALVLFQLHPWGSALITVAVLLIGIFTFYVAMLVRISKFNRLFPISLELLARATRAGESMEQAFATAGNSAAEPVKGEFLQCVRQIRMGLAPDVCIHDLARRIDSVDLYLLSHTISIHQKLGGRLADALERLSSTIRDRAECEQKIKSMTSIGRYSVVAIVLMGMFVLAYMLSAQPQYIDNLFTSSLGQKLLAYAFVSEAVGLIWVGMTLQSDL